MNTKSFEILENSSFLGYLKNKGVSNELQQEWCNIIKANVTRFNNKDFYEISEIIESLAIAGIDGDIINMTACTISEDNDIEIDPGLAKSFMIYLKKANNR